MSYYGRIGILITVLFLFMVGHVASANSPAIIPGVLDSLEIWRLRGEFKKCEELIGRMPRSNAAEKASYLMETAEILRTQKQYETALQYLDSAGRLIDQLTDDVQKSRLLLYRGKYLKSVHGQDLAEMRDSIFHCYAVALSLLEGQEESFWQKSTIVLENARLYNVLGESNIAAKWYQELVNLMAQAPDLTDYRRGSHLRSSSIFYMEGGDFERPFILARIASYIMKSGPRPDNAKYVDCIQILANSLFERQEYQEAIIQYEEIIDFVLATYGKDNAELIVHYLNICQPLVMTGRYQEALSYYNMAIALISVNPDQEEVLPWAYNNIAETYENLGRYKEAEKYFHRSIDTRIHLFGPDDEIVYEGWRYFGEYYERRGDYKRALDCYQESMKALFPDFKSADIYDNPDFSEYQNKEQLFYLLFDKAGSLMKLYQQNNDNRLLQCADTLYSDFYVMLDELMASGYLDKSTMLVFQRFDEGLNRSIDCAVALFYATGEEKYLERAWQFMEKNKYVLLYKAMVNASTGTGAMSRTLARESDEIRMKLSRTHNYDSVFQLNNMLLKIQSRQDGYQDHKITEGINISEDQRQLTLTNIRAMLTTDHDVLVEYHWSNDHLFGFVVHRGKFSVVKSEITPALMESVEDYARSISHYSAEKADFVSFSKAAYSLYQLIFKPVEDILAKDRPDSLFRVTIIPDGPLATLPFDAFTSSADTTSFSYWSLGYLCKKYTFCYAYSLSILQRNMEKRTEVKEPSMLALSYSQSLDKSVDIEQLRSENELPYSAEEIERIKHRIAANAFLGDEATEGLFKTTAPGYSMIHLALHGKADTTDMFNSRLIFKRSPAETDDGELHAFELYDLDLSNLEFVMLSACETGLGKVYDGEGIFSIARGFAYAGCPSMVMSLWKVNDRTTADLVDNFYAELCMNQPIDVALRRAKLDFLMSADDLSAHPANWAALIAIGNSEPVTLPSAAFPWRTVITAVVLMILMWMLWRRYRLKGF